MRGGNIATTGAVLVLLAGCRSATEPPTTAPSATPVVLREVEGALDFQSVVSGTRPLNALQTIGRGCGFFDANKDGNLDILMVAETPVLYLGDGTGKFQRTDWLAQIKGNFIGCAVGDYNRDGYEDLYLSAYRGGRLLRNQQGKAFVDATTTSKIAPQPFGTACSWVETVPGSGNLDLFVANYCRFGEDQGQPLLCAARSTDGKPLQTSCPPRHYPPLPAVLFRNSGSGTFTATATPTTGRGLGVAAVDTEGSGTQQVAFANDEIEGDFLQFNKLSMTNTAAMAGLNVDRDGNVHGGMGMDWGDYDNDGKMDLIVATFHNEPKSLYHNEGQGIFVDEAQRAGTSFPLLPYVSFGVKFFDADNDGWLDLLFANGHVQDNIAEIDTAQSYRQPSVFLRNLGTGRFADLTKDVSPALLRPVVGRGVATGDYDNDGRVDALIGDIEGKPLLLHNESLKKNWVGFALMGTKSNKNGYGARVTLKVSGKTLVRHCHTDGSYLSVSDGRVHFGLGNTDKIESAEILWTSGKRQILSGVKTNQYNAITEPDS